MFGVVFVAFGVMALYASRAADAAPNCLRPILRMYEGFRITKVLFIVVGAAAIALGIVRASSG